MAWSVKYFCGCRESKDVDVPETLSDDRCFHPLNYLYFCEDCGALRCPYCVDKEVVSCFCTMCLFEVTQAAALDSGNRCSRNCLRCPRCHANMTVQSVGDTYNARCASCDYGFDDLVKGPSLASQIDAKVDKERIEKLKAAYIDGKETNIDCPTESELPELAPLRARYSKYCKYCRNLMVNPDPQPNSSKMIEATMARNMVPEIQVFETDDKVQLSISNPTPLSLKVSFASADVKFSAPQVTLNASNGKKDDRSLVRGVSELAVIRETTASRQVFMEGSRKKLSGLQRGANWALIDLEVGAQKFTVQVSVKFMAGEEEMTLTLWTLCHRS